MDCAQARDSYVELLSGRLDAGRAASLQAHLDGCDACRAELEPLREMWLALGEVALPPHDHARVERVSKLVDAASGEASPVHAHSSPRTRRWTVGLVAAAALAGMAAGVALGRRSPDLRPVVAQSAAAPATGDRWMLLLLEDPAAPALSDSAMRDRVAEYGAWARKLDREGRLVMAEKLADVDHPRVLGVAPASLQRDPARRVLGGFFMISAADSSAAERIASECPHLKYGGAIELRRVERT